MIEPEVDEVRFAEAQRIVRVTALRATPIEDDRCSGCLYYLDPDEGLSFCWHEKLGMLVDADWWCHFFETREDS
jgi:hypothetical protein